MSKILALLGASVLVLAAAANGTHAATTANTADSAAQSAGAAPPAARVEAHSATLLAVGIVHGDRMAIHLSRSIDNAPVRDAVVTVVLRGTVHPTTAEADGSYSLKTRDLGIPGPAAAVFQVAENGVREELKGTLDVADPAGKSEDKNSARQYGWWVLNFAVCIGFLLLLSRRRKAASAD